MVRRAVLAVAPNDQGVPQRSAAPIESGGREAMNPDSHPLVVSVCYIRLSASELHASARFAADIFGLERVAGQKGEIAFRSDHRFRTLSFSNGSSGGSSIGIEVWNEQALDEIETRLRGSGIVASRVSAQDCQLPDVYAALPASDGSAY